MFCKPLQAEAEAEATATQDPGGEATAAVPEADSSQTAGTAAEAPPLPSAAATPDEAAGMQPTDGEPAAPAEVCAAPTTVASGEWLPLTRVPQPGRGGMEACSGRHVLGYQFLAGRWHMLDQDSTSPQGQRPDLSRLQNIFYRKTSCPFDAVNFCPCLQMKAPRVQLQMRSLQSGRRHPSPKLTRCRVSQQRSPVRLLLRVFSYPL